MILFDTIPIIIWHYEISLITIMNYKWPTEYHTILISSIEKWSLILSHKSSRFTVKLISPKTGFYDLQSMTMLRGQTIVLELSWRYHFYCQYHRFNIIDNRQCQILSNLQCIIEFEDALFSKTKMQHVHHVHDRNQLRYRDWDFTRQKMVIFRDVYKS